MRNSIRLIDVTLAALNTESHLWDCSPRSRTLDKTWAAPLNAVTTALLDCHGRVHVSLPVANLLSLVDDALYNRVVVHVNTPNDVAAVDYRFRNFLMRHPATELRSSIVGGSSQAWTSTRRRLDRVADSVGLRKGSLLVMLSGALSCEFWPDIAAAAPQIIDESHRLLSGGYCSNIVWEDSTNSVSGRATETLIKTALAAGIDLPENIEFAFRNSSNTLNAICKCVEFGASNFVCCNAECPGLANWLTSADVLRILAGVASLSELQGSEITDSSILMSDIDSRIRLHRTLSVFVKSAVHS